MKRIATLLLLLAFLSGSAQSLTGFWTGELRLQRVRGSLQVQLELMPTDQGDFLGVIRSRVVENNIVSGCDNLVRVRWTGDRPQLTHLSVIRETEVPEGACSNLATIRFTHDDKNPAGAELRGTWMMPGNEPLGTLQLQRQDTTVSFSTADDINAAFTRINEMQIARTPDDGQRIALMLNRPVAMSDTVVVHGADSMVVRIEGPEADRFHQLTVLLNGEPVKVRHAIRQRDLVLQLPNLEKGEAELMLLSDHGGVEVFFPVILTVQWGAGADQRKTMRIPVSTFRNQAVLIRVEH